MKWEFLDTTTASLDKPQNLQSNLISEFCGGKSKVFGLEFNYAKVNKHDVTYWLIDELTDS